MKIEKLGIRYFLPYLGDQLTYKNVQYLILILETNGFDPFERKISLEAIVFELYTKKKKYPDDFHFMKQNNHFWEGKKASKYDAKSTIFS